MAPRRSHKGTSRRKESLPYCPDLGVHHMFFEKRHYTRGHEHLLRNFGAFVLDTTIAKPPQHTLLHRSMGEPPRPNRDQAYDLIGAAKEGGLDKALEIDNGVTEHLRRQMAILAMPTQETIERLTSKHFVTNLELARL